MTQPAPLFTALTSRLGDRVHVVVAGELDLITAPILERELQEAARHRGCTTLLEVSGLTFCDLIGQRVLRRAVDAGACLVDAPPRCLVRLCDATGQQDLLRPRPVFAWRAWGSQPHPPARHAGVEVSP